MLSSFKVDVLSKHGLGICEMNTRKETQVIGCPFYVTSTRDGKSQPGGEKLPKAKFQANRFNTETIV